VSGSSINTDLTLCHVSVLIGGILTKLLEYCKTYILRASNFRDLSKIAKLNTHEFLELPITMSLFA